MLLPTKIDLNKAKAQETKRQIDEGLSLAKRVDAMRLLRVEQETKIKKWKDETVKIAQEEINKVSVELDEIKKELIEVIKVREELKKPLDLEWNKVKEEQKKFTDESNNLFLDKERFYKEVSEFEQVKNKISKTLESLEEKEKSIDKLKLDTEVLNKRGIIEYETARINTEKSKNILEDKIEKVNQSIIEYKGAMETIEIREKQVQEKEEDLLTREKVLEDKYKTLERTINRLNKQK